MTQIILMLPESVAREAEAAGLLRPKALARLLCAKIRPRNLNGRPVLHPRILRACQTA